MYSVWIADDRSMKLFRLLVQVKWSNWSKESDPRLTYNAWDAAGTSKAIYSIMDEIDTLYDPSKSELNIPYEPLVKHFLVDWTPVPCQLATEPFSEKMVIYTLTLKNLDEQCYEMGLVVGDWMLYKLTETDILCYQIEKIQRLGSGDTRSMEITLRKSSQRLTKPDANIRRLPIQQFFFRNLFFTEIYYPFMITLGKELFKQELPSTSTLPNLPNLLSMEIDNYKFTLLKRSGPTPTEEMGNEEVVSVQSETKDSKTITTFAYYVSQSDAGFARLCVLLDREKWHFSTSNYLTSSLVHIKLQLFIKANIHLLPIGQTEDFKELCGGERSEEGTISESALAKALTLDDDKRISTGEPVFELLAKCSTEWCFSGKPPPTPPAQRLSKIKNVVEFVQELKKNTDNSLNQEFVQAYENDLKDEKNPDLMKKIEAMYVGVSTLMQNHFTVNWSTSSHVGAFPFIFPQSKTEIHHELYSVEIESKDSTKTYTLIFSNYTIQNFHAAFNNQTYSIVINIIPPNAKIDQYGLYTQITSAGVYIYKIFESQDLCDIKLQNRSLTEKKTCYVFLGDVQTKVWPLNKQTKTKTKSKRKAKAKPKQKQKR